jgi:hypothetical protein
MLSDYYLATILVTREAKPTITRIHQDPPGVQVLEIVSASARCIKGLTRMGTSESLC